MSALTDAFTKLESAIQKQWGEIPTEIEEELNAVSVLLKTQPGTAPTPAPPIPVPPGESPLIKPVVSPPAPLHPRLSPGT